MTTQEMMKFRFALEQELAALNASAVARELLEVSREADPIDVTQSAAARDFEVDNINRISQKRRAVREAIDRIQDGSYGECQRCEEPIAPKRLQAVPWAVHCIRCQELIDAEGSDANEDFGNELAA